jgi:hypothetical protein
MTVKVLLLLEYLLRAVAAAAYTPIMLDARGVLVEALEATKVAAEGLGQEFLDRETTEVLQTDLGQHPLPLVLVAEGLGPLGKQRIVLYQLAGVAAQVYLTLLTARL